MKYSYESIKLSFDQRRLIMSLIRERKDECRVKLRIAEPVYYNYWITELTKIRNLKRAIIYKTEFKY